MSDSFGDGDNNEIPVHCVFISDFFISKYLITQKQWKSVAGSNPSFFNIGDDYPVEKVSWNDVQEFIQLLNQKTGDTYRLPTEAEWEYASRSSGNKEKWAGTSSEADLSEFAWYRDNTSRSTHPVVKKEPNRLGLYDMSGNLWELVQDKYISSAYKDHSQENPLWDLGSPIRVIR